MSDPDDILIFIIQKRVVESAKLKFHGRLLSRFLHFKFFTL